MRRFLPLCILAAFASSAIAQKTPEEALKAFTVADGLQLELFASEPMFVNPTCIDVDHKGRVWVCESVNYRCDLRKVKRNRAEGDRLVVLEDTDGDGKADKSHTFYQEKDFIAPLGVAVSPNPDGKGQKVYICHSPHIYLFEDNDGDLKADGPPKVLLTGFRGYDHDHGVHGIHFGPDGKLYFSVGDTGVDGLKSASGVASAPRETKVWKSNSTDCRAGTIWRCNPDGTNLELLAHNFRNQYEPAVDSFGTIFTSDNDDDGNQQTRICYVMPGGNYGYHPRGKGESHWHEEQPGVVHKVLRTGFGSPTGLCWYEGELLRSALGSRLSATGQNQKPNSGQPAADSRQPTAVYGLLLHTDAGPREVRCFVVKTKGAGYEAEQINLVTSSDNWFRPSDVCVAPDGSIFVSDWYDPGVGGHGMGDTTRGRIYRITAKGQKGYKMPPLDPASVKGRKDLLASSNLASRYLGFQSLFLWAQSQKPTYKDKMEGNALYTADAQFADDVGEACHFPKGPSWMEGRGLWLENHILTELGPINRTFGYYGADPLQSQLPRLKLHRCLREQMLGRSDVELNDSDQVIDLFNLRLVDPMTEARSSLKPVSKLSPATARELLIALRDIPPEGASKLFYALAKLHHGQDPFYLAAINIAVGTDPKRREIILADFEKHFPEWNDKVARLVWELRPPQVIAKLDQKLADPKLTAAQKGQILDILAVSEGVEPGLVMVKLLDGDTPAELKQRALENLKQFLPTRWAALKDRPELEKLAAKLLAKDDTRIAGLELIGAGRIDNLFSHPLEIAQNDKEKLEVRRAAVRIMGEFRTGSCARKLGELLHVKPLQQEVLRAIGQHGNDPAREILVRVIQDEKEELPVRQDAVAALAGFRQGAQWLLAAHEKKELPEALLADSGRLLRNSPYPDLRNKALIAFPAPGKIDPKKMPTIASLLKRNGDAASGKVVLAKNKDLGCVRCHTVRGQGGQIGPDLSMIGKKASRENLFESILQPDKAVADQFVRWIVATADGVTLDGLIVEETGEHVLLRDANGKDTKVLKSDLTGRKKSPNSLMPADLLAHMTEQDLVDMVAYLETLKTPALSVDSWHILGPFDNGGGDDGLDRAYAPEVLVVEGPRGNVVHDGKHGKIRWRVTRPNGEGYVDLAAFHAPNAGQTVSYLWKEIASPVDQDATVLIGTDDGCKLWINGKEVLSHRRHESARPERDTISIKLKQGRNTILLKINNGDGPHGFYFSVVSEQELKATPIK